MFSVRRGKDDAQAAAGGVLPRALRKPARFLARVFAGEVEVSRFAAPSLIATLFAATAVYGAWLGGHMPDAAKSVLAGAGFAVTQVRITGNRDTSEIDVIDAIGLDGFTPLFGLDVEKARARVAAMPWIQDVTIRKVYPDAIEVHLTERTPYAIWQHDGTLSVIEKSGAIIAPFAGTRHAALPLIVGKGATAVAPDFIAKFAEFPALARRVTGYVRVADRRWDLRIDNMITVRLPESGEDAAIAELARMDGETRLLSADIVEVDLRLADRVAVRLSPEAAETRAELVKARLKPKPVERQT